MSRIMEVLVVEDGWEYIERARRWLGEGLNFTRAGCGEEALALLESQGFDVLYLDMDFRRVPPDQLLGDVVGLTERFHGDPAEAQEFLATNQGVYILSALREAGSEIPVVFSYDFQPQPRRWAYLARRYGPVAYLGDNAEPAVIRALLLQLATTPQ